MSHPTDPQKESESTYVVQDRSNQDEMARLKVLDKLLTTGMGGVLPELDDSTLSRLRRVLDVGCGTGGWLIETARTYPQIEKLVGADISSTMTTYACVQAEESHLAKRVRFVTMDALRLLEFPDASFDLVNQRQGVSWIRTWEWSKILWEYQRLTRAGGIIRITEGSEIVPNTPAYTKFLSIVHEAFYNAGRLFSRSGDGLTEELPRLMTKHGVENVQTQVHTLIYRAGTVEGQIFYENVLYGLRVSLPFLQKWTNIPSDYQEICQQVLEEVQQPDFVATQTLLTAWGTRSTSLIPTRGSR
jgi:ubiquinone/menaquinone biosynthesis C-methylase UbiE